MKLIILSGQSGSGKSVALHTLEDSGYYCVDNLPLALLPALVDTFTHDAVERAHGLAVGIDVRCGAEDLARHADLLREIRERHPRLDVTRVFLKTDIRTLIRRYSETRRRHPLSQDGTPLREAIAAEEQLLLPVLADADLILDTSGTHLHELRHLILERVVRRRPRQMALLLQSFGFKHGIPLDTDFLFDVRFLPNPHWSHELRALTGRDEPVRTFLEGHPEVERSYRELHGLIAPWVDRFHQEQRSYLTLSIGCTGGQHRSVYLVERLASDLREHYPDLMVRHRELQ